MTDLDSLILELSKTIVTEESCRDLGRFLGSNQNDIDSYIYGANKQAERISQAARQLMQIKKRACRTEEEAEKVIEKAFFDKKDIGEYKRVYEEIYKKPFVRTQEQRNIPQASGSDDVDAPTRKTKRGKRLRVDEEEDSGEEEDDFNVPTVTLRGHEPYSLNYEHLCKVVIINNEFFDDTAKDRPGTEEDKSKLIDVLQKINPKLENEHAEDLIILENMRLEDLKKKLTEVAKSDFGKYAYFMCIVLSHGGEKGISAVDSKKISVRELTGYFKGDKCKTLRGKPKIFFFQACRGGEEEFGVEYPEEEREEEDVDEEEDDDDQNKLPKEADVFIHFSAPEGYKSIRHSGKGSRFIQCLCAALKKLHASKHLSDIGTITNKLVSETKGKSGRKIVSQMSSTLRKDLFLAK